MNNVEIADKVFELVSSIIEAMDYLQNNICENDKNEICKELINSIIICTDAVIKYTEIMDIELMGNDIVKNSILYKDYMLKLDETYKIPDKVEIFINKAVEILNCIVDDINRCYGPYLSL